MSISLAALIVAGTPVAADLPPPEPVIVEAVPVEAGPVEAGPVDAGAAAPSEPEHEHEETPVGNEIVVTSGPYVAPPGDPLAQLNAQSYDVTQKVDDAFVAPIAKGYEDVVPGPVRTGLRNFLHNLKTPVIFLNFMLQLKPGKAFETLGRFAINSTIGIGGLIDVAKNDPFNLPYRENGFANTLGYYGVGPGPFFFLPLVGPTTLRDMVGGAVDGVVLPTLVGKPFNDPIYTLTTGTIRSLDYRIEFNNELERQRATEDPYTASREFYLQRRHAEIEALHGRVVVKSSAFTAPPVTLAPVVATPTPADVIVPVAMPPAPQELQFISEPVVQPLP